MRLPKTKIENISIKPGRRILALSDIHGYLSYLRGALEKVQFCENDLLFIVGDIIEKGPDNLATLRYVMELCKQGNVIPLIGNVDAMRMELIANLNDENAEGFYDYILGLRRWASSSFFDELANECGYKINSPHDMVAAKDDIIAHFEREFDFLAELPTVVQTQNFVFVHGGLADKNIDDNRDRGLYELTKYDNFMSRTEHGFDKYLVVGHHPVNLYSNTIQQLNPVFDHEKKIISIDGGCGLKKECQLNVLIIPDIDSGADEISFASYDELPTIRALERQEARQESVHIHYLNRTSRLIEQGSEFSLFEHISSGRKLYVPNSYIKGDVIGRDYTDYILAVEKGDRLALLETTSKGCIVKRDGVVGWYLGKYE